MEEKTSSDVSLSESGGESQSVSDPSKITLLFNGTEVRYKESSLKELEYFKAQLSPPWNLNEGPMNLMVDGVDMVHMDLLVTRLENGRFPEGQSLGLVMGTARLCKFLNSPELFSELVEYFESKMPGIPIADVQAVAEQSEFPEFSEKATEVMIHYTELTLKAPYMSEIIHDMSVSEQSVLNKLRLRTKYLPVRSSNTALFQKALRKSFYTDSNHVDFDPKMFSKNKDVLFRIWRLLSAYCTSKSRPTRIIWELIDFEDYFTKAVLNEDFNEVLFTLLDDTFSFESRPVFCERVLKIAQSYKGNFAHPKNQYSKFEAKFIMYCRKCPMK
eukprot:608796_1